MYSYENYYKVKEEIESRRIRAISEADARAEELRSISEEIKAIDEELSSTGLHIFKVACSGGDIAPIRAHNEELSARRLEIIKRLGYPEDYTDVKFTCPTCSDTGYIGGTRMCSCLREELIRATIQSSGIGNLIEKQSFDNFDLELYKDNPEVYERMKRNLSLAKSFVTGFAKNKGNILLVGTTGTGKTHISTAIAREIIHQGYDVVYDSIHNIIYDFEADKFKSGYNQTDLRSEKYLECDLLIIDDLGTEFSNQFTISCLYNLINTRINRGLSTIISTNLTATELSEKYDGRICSRLLGRDTLVLMFGGKDMRIFKK